MAGRQVVFLGGADDLQLSPDGEIYHPGDIVSMPDVRRAAMAANGLRFGAVPDAPEPEPEPMDPPPLEPAEVSVAVIEETAPARASVARPSKEKN